MEIDSLLTVSDAAMYECKTAGKNTYTFSKSVPETNASNGDWIQWDESHCVGVDEIDDQHLHLTTLVNSLNSAIKTNNDEVLFSQLLDQIIDYTIFHFETEHRLMETFHYPKLKEHDLEHERLLQEVRHYKNCAHEGIEHIALMKIKDWLLNHIEYADKPLGVFISNRMRSSK
jgi:methyl-accepting chemotaxis protein/hemerythrin